MAGIAICSSIVHTTTTTTTNNNNKCYVNKAEQGEYMKWRHGLIK